MNPDPCEIKIDTVFYGIAGEMDAGIASYRQKKAGDTRHIFFTEHYDGNTPDPRRRFKVVGSNGANGRYHQYPGYCMKIEFPSLPDASHACKMQTKKNSTFILPRW